MKYKNTRIIDARSVNKQNLEAAYVLDDNQMRTEIEEALRQVREAGRELRGGATVAFPTETVYGLGANALDEAAVSSIFEAKGRPSDNPLICHIGRASDIGELTSALSPDLVKLMDNFWPGPLTIIVNKSKNIPNITTANLDTVGVRLPDSEIAIELIRASGVPVAAPSANLSGSPSPTNFQHVIADLDGKVDIIIKGPDSEVGIESTVLDMTAKPPLVLRPGIISKEMISAAIAREVSYEDRLENWQDIKSDGPYSQDVLSPRSPGQKYKHYAPKAKMIVVEGQRDKVKQEVLRLAKLNGDLGQKVGTILFEEDEYIRAAQSFYAQLRQLDEEGVDLIVAGALSYKDGVGFAVLNRMLMSSGYNIVRV